MNTPGNDADGGNGHETGVWGGGSRFHPYKGISWEILEWRLEWILSHKGVFRKISDLVWFFFSLLWILTGALSP